MTSLREQLRNQSGSYIPAITAVFFAVFDPSHGPKVVCQVPEGSISTALSTFPKEHSPADDGGLQTDPLLDRDAPGEDEHELRLATTQVLFDFSSVLEYVIPKKEVCDHLVTKATRTNKILGFPVRIKDEKKYSENGFRNAFTFNLCFVFEREAELSCFEPIVRKTARVLKKLEIASSLLSSPPPDFQIANVLEQLHMDLNAYSEASISLPGAELHLMIFPFYVNPKLIKNWDVPLAVANLEDMKHPSWDVTLYKVCTYVNGINSVKKIAELAEVDYYLARQSVQHLLYYGAVVLVDLFQYSNSYAALPSIPDIAMQLEDDEDDAIDLCEECERYVYSGKNNEPIVPFTDLFRLYSRLRAGLSVADWVEEYKIYDLAIDVRRMITYGVIKGFLRRVHAYPTWMEHPSLGGRGRTPRSSGGLTRPDVSRFNSSGIVSSQGSNRSSTSGHRGALQDAPAPPVERTALAPDSPVAFPESVFSEARPSAPFPASLPSLLDGSHPTDEICLKYGLTFAQLEGMLKVIGGAEPKTGATSGNISEREGEKGKSGVDGVRREREATKPASSPSYYGSIFMVYV